MVCLAQRRESFYSHLASRCFVVWCETGRENWFIYFQLFHGIDGLEIENMLFKWAFMRKCSSISRSLLQTFNSSNQSRWHPRVNFFFRKMVRFGRRNQQIFGMTLVLRRLVFNFSRGVNVWFDMKNVIAMGWKKRPLKLSLRCVFFSLAWRDLPEGFPRNDSSLQCDEEWWTTRKVFSWKWRMLETCKIKTISWKLAWVL